jgi:geranylgeranyl pyrophosphate synthase
VPFMRVIQVLERHRSIARAYERAHTFTRKAREQVLTLPEGPVQRALQSIVELVTERSS